MMGLQTVVGVLASSKFLLVILAALFLVVYSTVSTVRSWRRLRHIPGPQGAAFSKWWMLRNTMGGSMHLATKAMCKQYGKPRLASARSVPDASPLRSHPVVPTYFGSGAARRSPSHPPGGRVV